jgi:CheY-like chemotaxis protein
MGGTITVDSAMGKGSTFTARLILEASSDSEDAIRVAPAELPGRSALVVDDNDTNRRILRRQLENGGMRVEDQALPLEALAQVKMGARYDVFILDMQMPAMNGLELARALRDVHDCSQRPIVLLTSLGHRLSDGESMDLVQLVKPDGNYYALGFWDQPGLLSQLRHSILKSLVARKCLQSETAEVLESWPRRGSCPLSP